ncbi:DUF58 domain-containing protein [Candidatus Palauibacter sp.]|uniref:DUF58 domain-containing protein n=1 Tax=Candidatus Palauibacter sp. TaxID=3101350 RepID=UPI003C703C58
MRARITSRTVPGTQFLDPTVLTRIGNLELVARYVVEGFIAGAHGSPFLGRSLDFAAHRQYLPGDDIRKIDWKVYGRTDRHYIKEYEAETNANVFFAIDASRSMDYGSQGITKLDYARYLAACLVYLSASQRDRVGTAVFDDKLLEYIPPSVRHRRLILAALDRISAETAGDLTRPLIQVAESLTRKGIVVLLSDLYAEPKTVLDSVGALRSKGQDVIVFQILDPAEVDFPFEAARSFEDLETGERIPVMPDDMRTEYLSLVEGHVGELSKLMIERGIDHELAVTSVPLDAVLFRYLSHRARRLKGKER